MHAQKRNVEYDEFLALCGETCACCGSPLDYGIGRNNNDKLAENTPSTDHIIPRSRGGEDSIENYWIICVKCNTLKNDATHEDIARMEGIIRVLHETRDKSLKTKELKE